MTIGGMTRVGKGAVVEATCVGAHVEIGAGAVVVGGFCGLACLDVIDGSAGSSDRPTDRPTD